jgi:serine phosphatase RsbU (regulator of sigma subunit)/anti-sigma regulatory factor (Ser/Thr protein kinase)/TolA-binding protein
LFQKVEKEQLKVPAKIEYLGELRDFVTKVGRRHGFSERVINAFKLSIDEAATNIIKHAYRDWPGNITMRAIVKKNSLTIVLIDQGKYFDPRQVSDPDLKRYVDIGKKGGLGIFIMRRLLDQIEYRKTEEGNELWLIKHRDVPRRAKMAVPAIPVTLKVRYWVVSLLAFTVILIAVYFLTYMQRDNQALQDYLTRGKAACSSLASDVYITLQNPELGEDRLQFLNRDDASQIFSIMETLGRTVNKMLLSIEYKSMLHYAIVVDRSNNIIASTDAGKFLQIYQRPKNARELEKDVFSYVLSSDERVVDIGIPVQDEKGRRLCDVHFIMNYKVISEQTKQFRLNDLRVVGVVWLLGAAGLFLLIYIVMNPFRRLSEWVKALGQPGAAQEMDIDASTEIGEIAQAFSDITMKLRESQVNLAEQERLQKEMQVAQEIQQTLLPSDFPQVEGYEISSYYAAAKEVGGDYYDFVEVDKDTIGIVVADVSGKGVPGSLVMTMIRTALRTEARGIKDAAEVLSRVNDFVVNDMKKGMFVTLFYVIIDSKRRKVNYASAGHNPMILFRASKSKTYYLNPHGFPIGISLPDKDLFRNTIQSDTISLAEDDIIIIYTDGITEAMNRKRALFGEERFLEVIREHGTLPPNAFVDRLHEEILSFTEGNPQNDDITLVAIKEKTTAEKIEFSRAVQVFDLAKQGKAIKEACDQVGLSTYAYYNKYRDKFDKDGTESFEIVSDGETLEAKHLSIEEKTKIYDVITHFPEYGAKKISEEVNSERYGFAVINVSRIYDELVKAHLNTRELREAFINRGGRKRRIKPPGTPLLTLDGRVIIQRGGLSDLPEEEPQPQIKVNAIPRRKLGKREKESAPPAVEAPMPPAEVETTQPPTESIVIEMPPDEFLSYSGRDILSISAIELFTLPLEDLFDKRASQASMVDLAKFLEAPALAKAVEQPDKEAESVEPAKKASVTATTPDPEEAERLQIADLDIPINKRLLEKPSNDELDFAELLASGDGIAEKQPEKSQPFAAEQVEDVTITEETTREQKVEEFVLEADLAQPFDELLEMEDEQHLVHEDGELAHEITEQIIKQEIDEQLDADRFFSLLESMSPWDIRESEGMSEPTKISETEQPKVEPMAKNLDFDELLVLLEDESQQPNMLMAMGQSSVAANFFGSMADKTGSVLEKAINHYEQEQFPEAIREFENVLQRQPQDREVRLLLGNAYFRCRKYREAAKVYEAVISQDPENADAFENLGVVYANQGNFRTAIEVWEQLLRISPSRQDIRDSIDRARRFLQETG